MSLASKRTHRIRAKATKESFEAHGVVRCLLGVQGSWRYSCCTGSLLVSSAVTGSTPIQCTSGKKEKTIRPTGLHDHKRSFRNRVHFFRPIPLFTTAALAAGCGLFVDRPSGIYWEQNLSSCCESTVSEKSKSAVATRRAKQARLRDRVLSRTSLVVSLSPSDATSAKTTSNDAERPSRG